MTVANQSGRLSAETGTATRKPSTGAADTNEANACRVPISGRLAEVTDQLAHRQ